MNATLPNVAMLVSVCLMLAFLGYAFLHRRERGIRYFAWIMAGRVIYAGSVIMETTSSSLHAKLLFRNVQQTSLIFSVPLVLFFTLDLLGKNNALRRLHRSLLVSLFALWSLLVWTNPLHRLLYDRTILRGGHLEVDKSNLSISFNIVCYLLLAACIFFLFDYLRHIRRDIRTPGLWLLLCGCIPSAMEVVKLTNPGFTPWILPASVYCGFFGMAMLWIVIRYRIFSIVPLARSVVVETMREGILIVNHSGRVIDSNKYVEPLFAGRGDGPLAERQIGELLAPWPEWLRACERMEAGELEIAALAAGEQRVYSVKVYPLAPRGKVRQGTVSVLFDITDKQRTLEQIVRLNQLKDRLFAVVSHDIRDPLAVQMTLLEALEADKPQLGRDQQDAIDALSGQVHNTYNMIENLLDWYRGQKDGLLLHPQALRLADEVDEVCRMLKIKSEFKQIAVIAEIESGLAVQADREAVALIIRNLVTNAIKYSYPGGNVRVRAKRDDDRIVISVEDQGVGMDNERAAALVDPMSLGSTAGTAGEKGTGLGLQVCRQFVGMSGGQIWAESAPGQGSTFYFTLPAADLG
ncbi:sensor histidine kinase [Cohnella hashimotonis]|uniref:histidine kinase n=1 Tax=Cohnella hashimotonis TaxID=2826895 RepID=A0ABT6TSE6_9BACL|nr:histidine kinase N-terminal 7TM domain-containing protein [Cohnella hashimotonis]MDI4649777.1 histidine kinase N-terminal 7TM domain-containing protein [Cohnella hashimotonis]